MNKELSKELHAKITTLALKKSYAYGTEEWESSSKNIQDELTARGIKDIKFYYEYKMPGGLLPAAYMVRLALYTFYLDFDWLIKKDDFQQEFKNLIPSETERLQVIDEIKSKSRIYDNDLTKDCEELIKLNPELSVITDKHTHRDDILWGAVFGTAPVNIEYFCNGIFKSNWDANNAKQEVIREKLKSYGLTRVGVLDPKFAEKLISVLEKNKQSVIMDNNGREIK